MTNKELTRIRKDRELSKKEFAALLGITPTLLGCYEKGSCPIPDSVAMQLAAAETRVKKSTGKTAGKAEKATGIPNIIIQSPMGGCITPADIAGKVPKDTEDVYVRVDVNKLYYVLKNGESGEVDIWE